MTRKKTRRFWSTLEEYEQLGQVEKLKQEEFYSKPETVLGQNDTDDISAINRRDFLRVSGAAAVISMVACSERSVEKIIPYVNAPEEITPGLANYYASSSDVGNVPVVVKTREGRPILIDVNNLDSGESGLTARTSASIYDLYDPARARYPMQINRDGSKIKIDWQTADSEIAQSLAGSGGEIVLLTGSVNGPTRKKLIADFLSVYPSARHVQVDANSNDDLRQANMESFAVDVMPSYSFDKAEYMVFLGGDVLADSRDLAKNAGAIAKTRRFVEEDIKMSRIVSFEPSMSEIGMLADYRHLVKNEDMVKVAYALINEILPSTQFANRMSIRAAVGNYGSASVETDLNLKSGSIKKVAEGLIANKGKSVVYGEGLANQTKNGKALHIAINCLNAILDNLGNTVDFEVNTSNNSNGSMQSLADLVTDMNNGKVGAVFLYGTNPSYFYHDVVAFETALKNVKTLVSFNDRIDETSRNFDYLLPSTHSLESWGDREFVAGKYSIVQPTISPIWDNRSFEDSLIQLASKKNAALFTVENQIVTAYDYLRNIWRDIHSSMNIAASFEKFWISFVRDGIFDSNKNRYNSFKSRLSFNEAAFNGLDVLDSSGMTLSVYESSPVGDGSQNNNAYLLELPHPVSKICWDNYISMSFSKGRELGIKINDIVSVTIDGKTHELPVNLQPGQHNDVVTLAAGWGRTAVGAVGNNEGVNAFALTNSRQFSGLAVTLTKTDETHQLVNVQGHQYIDDNVRFTELHDHHNEHYRPVVFEASLHEYKENPKSTVKYHTEQLTEEVKNNKIDNMWNRSKENIHKYPGHHWGMTVDLNSCTGCNACTVACNVENNIPVVGRKEVAIGREMNWIRIDRYYVGDEDNPQVINQPMMCQHCDNAPCETVCPVVATTHNGEGLNLMTYNRCVGTRYCANNCPYKVRRFNFHEYTKGNADKGFPAAGLGSKDGLDVKGYDLSQAPMNMVLNPDVLVREKGVMEKCTFCTQRIREAKYKARFKGVSANEIDFTTACASACPTNAIIFGDMNDPESQLNEARKTERVFGSLAELNTEPSVAYLARIRNQDEPVYVEVENQEAH